MRKLVLLLAVAAISSPAAAVSLTVDSVDTPQQDVLLPHFRVHELGILPFPPDELISATWIETDYTPCSQNPDDQFVPNAEVTIVNLTPTAWVGLVYVADPETWLANDDGLVNGELAFNIDAIGFNTPLVYEDNPNHIFEPGETWKFVIQDYANALGLAPSALGSVGKVGGGSAGDSVSSGSIIAVPEPLTMFAVFGSLVGLGGYIRKRRMA